MIFWEKKSSLSVQRLEELVEFQKKLKISFREVDLLDVALVHSSVSSERNNERLEFIGDAVLGLVTSDELYRRLKVENEGVLTKMKAFVICEETLARIGFGLEFEKYLSLGKGEEKTGGRKKKAIIADAVEAVIGAYYIDSGFEKVRKFVLSLVSFFVSSVVENKAWYDYKSLLQVMMQKNYKDMPSYKVVSMEGPDHNRIFYVQVTAAGNVYGPSEGKSKKEAEQNVARLAYQALCK